MPKIKSTLSAAIRQWIREYNRDAEVLLTDGKVVRCLVCEKDVSCKKKNHVDSHCNSASHVAALCRLKKSKLKQQTISSTTAAADASATLHRDLCEAFLCANIPMWKLENPKLKSFLETYTKKNIPNESTLRKNYVPKLFDETMAEVRRRVSGQYVYTVVDETTNERGEYVANLLLGVLTPHEARNPYLIASSILEKTNAATVGKFINDSLMEFYRGERFSARVLLLVTDAAPYMVSMGQNLHSIYTNLIHVTCVAHALHRIAEKVRESFPDVNHLISWSRKVFLKSPARASVYREIMKCALPPDVVVTRWGSWLTAALFFANHFPKFCEVVSALKNDSAHVQKLQVLLASKKKLGADLAFINAHLAFLPAAITKLEERGLSLNDQITIIDEVRTKIYQIPGSRGSIFRKKTDFVFTKNGGYSQLHDLNESLLGEIGASTTSISDDPAVLSSYTYAPLVSVDVERSFSDYKIILTDRRMSFTQSNLEKYVVVMFNRRFFFTM